MWARLCTGLLVLAMVAGGTTASPAHLHTANGHRVAHDRDHAGNPAQPLWHAHGAPHAHDADAHPHESAASSPDDAGDHDHPEDVVFAGGMVASSPTTAHWSPPLLVAIAVARSTLDVSVRAWTATVGALPPVHAPPLIAPRSPRAPPTFARLSV
jgi:hypothetical protein